MQGKGALEAAYISELEIEMDVANKQVVAGALIDMAKFYDKLDCMALLQDGVGKGYPLPLLVWAWRPTWGPE